jgi:hypothetical protein
MIYLKLDTDPIEVGEKLTGICLWTPDNAEGTKPLKLTIGWRTEGRGTVDKDILYEIEINPSERFQLNHNIPFTAPISYDGELLRFIWEINIYRPQWLGLKDSLKTQVFQVIPKQMLS